MPGHAKMLRFGLIGTGSWGREHARAIRQEGGQLVYVVGTQASPPADFPLEPAQYYDRFDLQRLPVVDVVDIAAPNYLHADFARKALLAGYHVLVEKPMATHLHDARNLVELSRARGKILAVGYEMRFSPLWQQVRALIQSPAFGELRWIDFSLERHPFRPGRNRWRENPNQVGSWVIEEAVHHLDLICWLVASSPQNVEVSADFPGSPPPLANLLALHLRFSSGILASYRAAINIEGHHLRLVAYGSQASVAAEWHGRTDRTREPHVSLSWRSHGDVRSVPVMEDSGEVFELNREIRNVIAAISQKTSLWLSPEEALYNLALADAVERSAIDKRTLTFHPDQIY